MPDVPLMLTAPDTSGLMTKAEADATVADINARIAMVSRDRKSRLTTNASGFWSITYPANLWIGEPCTNVTPISASAGAGQLTLRVSKTLTAGQWKVDIQFTMLPVSVNIALLGVVPLGVNPGTVLFDYSAAEPNAVIV